VDRTRHHCRVLLKLSRGIVLIAIPPRIVTRTSEVPRWHFGGMTRAPKPQLARKENRIRLPEARSLRRDRVMAWAMSARNCGSSV